VIRNLPGNFSETRGLLVANVWGPAFSVVSGGVGCLLMTGLIASRTSQLRQYRASVHLTPAAEVREGGLS
jgi:hypothetical protein